MNNNTIIAIIAVATIVGAGIALVGGIAGALLQHSLYLRAERKKREWDRTALTKETADLFREIVEGALRELADYESRETEAIQDQPPKG